MSLLETLPRLLAEAMAKAVRWVQRAWVTRDEPPEGALWRGAKDTRAAFGLWRVRIIAGAVTIALGTWGTLLPSNASDEARIALSIGSYIGGAAVVGLVVLLWSVATAPLKQRNEARKVAGEGRATGAVATRTDELRLLLAKGHMFASLFKGGTMNVAATMNESTMKALKEWYDEVYRTLLGEGLRSQADRWLATSPLSAAEINVLNIAVAQTTIGAQLKCLEGIVGDLDRESRAGQSEPETLAREFSSWVRTKQAALPRGGWRQQVGLFAWGGESQETHSQRRLESERRQDEIERIHARARTEYHERFEARVAEVLGDTGPVREPETISDLEKLSVRVARAAGVPPSPKAALRTLSRDGFNLRNQIPDQPTLEQRKDFEPHVDSFRERAVEELSECAPEFVSELEAVPAYDPADLDGIPLKGERISLSDYMQRLLVVIGNAVKAV